MLLNIGALALFVKKKCPRRQQISIQEEFLTMQAFAQWGMDLVGPLSGVNVCYLMVMTEYLTKWAEVYYKKRSNYSV